MKRKTLLLGFACAAALWAVFLAARGIPEGYRKFLLLQAIKQQPVGLRDPVLSEMKAKMFGAGYEVGRAADPENKPTREAIFEQARAAAKELNVQPQHLEVCVDRFKEGFLTGIFEAGNEAANRQQEELVGR